MSYDLLMFRPLVDVRSQDDLSEQTVANLDAAEVMNGLSRLLPTLEWSRFGEGESYDHFHARYEDADTWYELSVPASSTQHWKIRSSHRAGDRQLIATICRSLGYIAFDGQAMTIIRPDGEIAA